MSFTALNTISNKPLKRVELRSFLGGMLGGAVVFLIAATLTGSGGALRRTVTIVEVPGVSSHEARLSQVQSVHKIYSEAAPGVVLVDAYGVNEVQSPSEYLRGEGGRNGITIGSGFEIDNNGTILTNWHIMAGASTVTVRTAQGNKLKARLVGKDPSSDLALLRIPVAGVTLHPLIMGDPKGTKIGDEVLAIGNPFGLGGTLTSGIISALDRQIIAPDGATIRNVLQTDAPINPGNSGGPLVDSGGRVIGINSQIETVGGGRSGNLGIAFAIPIDIAQREMVALEKGRTGG